LIGHRNPKHTEKSWKTNWRVAPEQPLKARNGLLMPSTPVLSIRREATICHRDSTTALFRRVLIGYADGFAVLDPWYSQALGKLFAPFIQFGDGTTTIESGAHRDPHIEVAVVPPVPLTPSAQYALGLLLPKHFGMIGANM
jgi:hypothetical protein